MACLLRTSHANSVHMDPDLKLHSECMSHSNREGAECQSRPVPPCPSFTIKKVRSTTISAGMSASSSEAAAFRELAPPELSHLPSLLAAVPTISSGGGTA